jgi:hypothetical protein
VLQGRALAGADPTRGRFRSYLLGALRHFLADGRDRANAAKRGAGAESVPLDTAAEASIPGTPPDESVFDREWALTVLSRALTIVEQEWADVGKGADFEILKPALTGTGERVPVSDFARALSISEGAAKVAIHRLRARFREIVKQEIAQTVPEESDVDEELRYLVSVLSQRTS